LHALQTTPAFPHWRSEVPCWQTPLAQQPVGQFELEQVDELLQVPFTQDSPLLQTAQVAPFLPQAAGSLPPLQTLFRQQPTQVVGPQLVLHCLETHFAVPLQTWQRAPPVPQAASRFPDWHWSPWQQPSGQEAVVQVHFCEEQAWLVPQLLHAPPPVPQRVLLVPGWHLPVLSQQPVAQLVGPQLVGTASQVFEALQNCCAVHCTQALPPVPQELCPLPGWQAPAASQQPVTQVVASHWTATQACF
jgi:hypothetical protein